SARTCRALRECARTPARRMRGGSAASCCARRPSSGPPEGCRGTGSRRTRGPYAASCREGSGSVPPSRTYIPRARGGSCPLFADGAAMPALQLLITDTSQDLTVLRNALRSPHLRPERRSHKLRFQNGAATHEIDNVPVLLVPPDREFRARERASLVQLGIVRNRLVVIQVLATQKEDAAVLELEEVVEPLILELFHAKRPPCSKTDRFQVAQLLELTNMLLGGLPLPERIRPPAIEQPLRHRHHREHEYGDGGAHYPGRSPIEHIEAAENHDQQEHAGKNEEAGSD